MRCLAVVFVMTGLVWREVSAGWGYHNNAGTGPDQWKNDFPDCGGAMQSPINVVTKYAVSDRNLEPFNFSDYLVTDDVHLKLENVGGHTAEVVLSGNPVYLDQGGLPARYILEQFHFHWGFNDSRGSEHSIDGKFAPLEVHFVHRQERFPSLSAAASKPFGLAVIAFLFKVGKANPKYGVLIENLAKIPNANDEAELESFQIVDLLPQTFDYYRYQGSLTTPPCSESVIWTLAAEPIEISIEQLEQFRSLRDENQDQLVDDFRPIQKLNHRTVRTNKYKTK
jgi:carbonic anhydrase